MRAWFILCLLLILPACGEAPIESAAAKSCEPIRFDSQQFTVCNFDIKTDKIEFYWKNKNDEIIGDFARLNALISAEDKSLKFAMNAGMYHEDRRPVGLYIENGVKTGRLQKRAANDNFGLLPNGVFWIDGTEADISETLAFERRFDKQQMPKYVTQSGPMLVINGKLHEAFKPDSQSHNIRNGVGISEDKTKLFFVISDEQVTFHKFARLFRDELKTPNALYLDGSISKLYSKELNRADTGAQMGPIIGVY